MRSAQPVINPTAAVSAVPKGRPPRFLPVGFPLQDPIARRKADSCAERPEGSGRRCLSCRRTGRLPSENHRSSGRCAGHLCAEKPEGDSPHRDRSGNGAGRRLGQGVQIGLWSDAPAHRGFRSSEGAFHRRAETSRRSRLSNPERDFRFAGQNGGAGG